MNKVKNMMIVSLLCIPLLTFSCFAQYYPTEVTHSTENGVYEVQKTYVLPSDVLPTTEMKENFVLDGYEYTLMDMMKQEMPQFSTQDVLDTVEIATKTNKLEDILPLLPATKEHTTEEGYMGELTLDVGSISIEIAGYSSGSKTLTESRTYANLSAADMSLIPQTVSSGGTSYSFASVDWQNSNDIGVDGHAIANKYTAVVQYTAVQKYSYVSGYKVTADYSGTLSKISQDTAQYTAIFRGKEYVPEEEKQENMNLEEQSMTDTSVEGFHETTGELLNPEGTAGFNWLFVAIPMILFVFPIVVYFGIKWGKQQMEQRKGGF